MKFSNSLFPPEDIAAFLAVPVAKLKNWREQGGGPKWLMVGTYVRYRMADVEQWIAEGGKVPPMPPRKDRKAVAR